MSAWGKRLSICLALLVVVPAVYTRVPGPMHVFATSAYASAVLADSPSVYYRLDESSGSTAADSSGNGITGTYGSGVTYGSTGALASETDTAVTGPGSTFALTASASSLPAGNAARTLEAWIKTTSAGRIIGYGNGFTLNTDTSSQVRIGTDHGSYYPATQYSIMDGAWHYVAVTFDGSATLLLYVDGQLTTTYDLGSVNTDVSSGLTAGSGASSISLDEAAVYPSVLSASRINAHWRAATGLQCTSAPTAHYATAVVTDAPVRYYRFGESSGAAALDAASASDCRVGAYVPGATHVGGAMVGETNNGVQSPSANLGVLASPDGLPSGNADRTLEGWVKGTVAARIVGYGNGFSVNTDTASQVRVGTDHGSYYVSTPYSIIDGAWHYVAVTFNGSALLLYVDGQLATTYALGGVNTGLTDPLSAGSDGNTVDEAAVYSSILSASHIKAHFMASGHTTPITAVTSAEAKTGGANATYSCSCTNPHANATHNPVDTESGNFWHTFTDVSISGRSYPLQLTRSYNSQDAATNGPFGYGWQYDYTMSLAVTGTSPNQVATVTQENGSQASFNQPSSGSSWAPSVSRFIATLTHNGDGTWTFVRQGRDTFTFNSSGQLTQEQDLNGYTTSFTYTSGNLTTITDPAGRTLTLGWTGSNITSLTDSNVSGNTRTVTYTYNGSGELTDVTDVNGGDTHFAYDSSHRITTMKSPVCEALGTSCPGVQNHYDGSGRVDWQKDELNRQTSFSYSGSPGTADGGTTTITDPKGNVTVDGYQYGVRTFETRGSGTASAATTSFLYDPSTLVLVGIVDPNGNLTTQTVDSNGNVLTTTDPLGRVTTRTYNSFNEVLTVQDGKGVTTTYTYDGHENLASTSTPVSGSSCTCQVVTYNHANTTYPGDVTSMVDPDSKTWSYGYDGNGYRVETKDPLSNVSAAVFNADGWVTETYTPKAGCTWGSTPPTGCSTTYKTAYSYVIPGTSTTDEFGDVQTITDPLSHVITYGYDANRNKTSVQEGNGNTTTYTFDKANQLTTTTRPDAGSTTLTTDYNDDGTVLDQKDGKGNAIQTYGYDSLARVTTVTDALSHVTTFTYDANGNRLSHQDPSGDCSATPKTNCTTMTYDAANELATVTHSDGATPNVTSITYDSDGQRTGMSAGTGSPTWSWDNLHRLSSYTNGNSASVSYSYNLRNLPTTITYPGSHDVTRGYDNASRLTSVQDWLGTPNTTSFGYDANSNLTTDTLQSGVVDTYTFNAADQMTGISDVNGGTTIFAATYTRDSNGQLAADNSVPTNQGSYKYTPLNQLCYAGSSTSNACSSPPTSSYPYAFDAADNLTTMENAAHTGTNTQQFDAADQLCWTVSGASTNNCATAPTGATTFNYDTRGNRTSVVPSSGSATCLAYDQESRLTSIKTGTGSSCTTPTTVGTYAYDGDGLRQSKAVSGTTTQFTWDPSASLPKLLQEKAGSANPTSYIYGPGGLPVEQIDTSGVAHFYHHDQLGSTRVISSAAGVSENTYTYDPYGNVTASTGTVTNPLQFSGEYQDSESGLTYLRARYYDPTTGQFLTRDPLVAKTRSAYAYVAGDPVNGTDPSGLDVNLPGGFCAHVPWGDARPCGDTGANAVSSTVESTPVPFTPAAVSEASACAAHSTECRVAWDARNVADNVSNAKFPVETDARKRLRHAIWSTLMSYRMGIDTAWDFAEAHEIGHPDEPAVRHLDELRNSVGMYYGQELLHTCGAGLTDQEIVGMVEQTVAAGRFG